MAGIRILNEVGATVVINGEERESVTVDCGTLVEWSVSKEGYAPQSGSQEVWEDTVLPVALVRESEPVASRTLVITAVPETAAITAEYGDGQSLTCIGSLVLEAPEGTCVEWIVSCEGYVTQTGGLTLDEDSEITVVLEAEEEVLLLAGMDGDPADSLTMAFPAEGGSDDADVLSNTSWSVADIPSGLTLLVGGSVAEAGASYKGDQGVRVIMERNTGAARSREVRFATESGEKEAVLTAAQAAATVTLTIIPTPSDATVVIAGVETSSLAVEIGTTVAYSVSADGYISESGFVEMDEDKTLEVVLVAQTVDPEPLPDPEYLFEIIPTPSDATVVINGEERTSAYFCEGDTVQWSVSADGYVTKTGIYEMGTMGVTLEVVLEEEGAVSLVCKDITTDYTAKSIDLVAEGYIAVENAESLSCSFAESVGWAAVSNVAGGIGAVLTLEAYDSEVGGSETDSRSASLNVTAVGTGGSVQDSLTVTQRYKDWPEI